MTGPQVGIAGVRTLQQQIGEWSRRNWPGLTLPNTGLKIAEEAGEVCRALGCIAVSKEGEDHEWHANLADELADVVITVLRTADYAGIDVTRALLNRWADVSQRDYRANPKRPKKED